MADEKQQPSLELILYKLDELNRKFDDSRVNDKERFERIENRHDADSARIRALEDESLRLKTTLLPLGMVFSAALGVAVKLFIDAITK